MATHLQINIKKLNRLFFELSTKVEKMYQDTVLALQTMDTELAQSVIDRDPEIDQLEIELEEECLKSLALHQPVAVDLRYIVAILKSNNDLERIGDLTTNIAERCQQMALLKAPGIKYVIQETADQVGQMLSQSIKAVLQRNTDLAIKICEMDARVDQLHGSMYRLVQEDLEKSTVNIASAMNYISISRFLERIADHSTNIAEDVIYMIHGNIVRHQFK